MKRIFVTLAAIALAGSSLQAAGTDPNLDYNVLQGRIASLESKVKMLEKALNELSGQIAEPSPTKISAPVTQNTEAPKAPATPEKAPATAAPQEFEKYAIQEGDTISEIARKLDVPRAELMEANDLREGQQIYIGDELRVPVPMPAPKKPEAALASNNTAPAPKAPAKSEAPKKSAPSAGSTYTVKAGDTLTKISREFGVSVAMLKSANNMSNDMLPIGKKLTIPGKNGGGSSSVASASSSSSGKGSEGIDELLRPDENYGVYTVEKGDTLYSLARDFFTSQSEIQRLNKLGTSTTLRPGQDLVVPTSQYEEHHQLANNG